MATSLYVAPDSRGNGSGFSPGDAADYLDFRNDDGFWKKTVATHLDSGLVSINFASGKYLRGPLLLNNVGHPSNRLVLHGAPDHTTNFVVSPAEALEDVPYFKCENCANLVIRYFRFSGAGRVNYVQRFEGVSSHIVIDSCVWEDLPNVIRGATGTSGAEISHIRYYNCTFKRVGVGPGAHMMYHAYGPQHITVASCTFEDCRGDYVRFRDKTDKSSVINCSFRNTGLYSNRFRFVSVLVRNKVRDEYFGTHFVFARNRFYHYSEAEDRYAISFNHRGYDPPGRHHLLTASEGETLINGSSNVRKALLQENCGIDTDYVRVYSNRFAHVSRRVVYESKAKYPGVISRGWEGVADIDSLVNADPTLDPKRWLEPVLVLLQDS